MSTFINVSFSLNGRKRYRDETQHRYVMDRLRKQIHHAQSEYAIHKCEHDYAKQQNFKQQITRFPSITK